MSVPVHSSVSGKVSKIDAIVDASGYRRPAIFVDVEGDEWVETIDRTPDLVTLGQRPELTAEDIVNKVKAAGIVGMGGATFPCHVKLTPPKRDKSRMRYHQRRGVRTVLDSRPSVAVGKAGRNPGGSGSDHEGSGCGQRLYRHREQQTGRYRPSDGEKAKAYSHIEIVPLQVKYPQGGEKQLIAAVTGREVPAPPALPINVGAVVQKCRYGFCHLRGGDEEQAPV